MSIPTILEPVADYYSAKVRSHGATPAGVDWNDRDGQVMRFDALLQLIGTAFSISLDDYGCGYGALLDHLSGKGIIDYLGLDVSEAMIEQAKRSHPAVLGRFVIGSVSPRIADYAVASGIFNVRLAVAPVHWEKHILDTLDMMNAHSCRGFAFNCLTSYSDAAFRKEYLYYGNPSFYFDLCKCRYAKNVALLHDYGLHEFTIHVRKEVI